MIFVLLIFFNTFYFIKYLADANFRAKILHLRAFTWLGSHGVHRKHRIFF